MATQRYREKFLFWLNLVDNNEFLIAEQISELKKQRRFASTIRDGIRLICDLRAGRLETLFELFPWVKVEFLAGIQPQETAGERAIRERLAHIEQQLLQQGNIPIQLPAPAPKALSGGPKQMAVPTFSAPASDDDEDFNTVVLKKDTSTDSCLNFVTSMMNL
jgi:hypothetical protein